MNMEKKQFFGCISVFIILTFSFTGCVDPIEEPELPERGFFMGLLPNPADGQDFADAYKQAAEYAEFAPVWSSGAGAAGFWDYAEKLDGWWGDIFLEGYIRGNGMYPLIHFSFFDKNQEGHLILKTPEDMADATLNDSEWRSLYKLSVLDVVNAARPAYLSLGNEVNRWYEAYGVEEGDPNGFQHYISLYHDIYDAVKDIAPETTIFCVFSREIVDENREANLSVLSLFDEQKLDMLVFTTYPIAVQGINQARDMPSDYYLEASNYMPQKPFGFSEIGWPTYGQAGGEQGQYDFLINLSTTLTIDQGIPLQMFMYCWLHDVATGDTTGLISRDGQQRLGYEAWKQISESS